ncbi:DoxX family membrane protein [Streptomyces sp. SCSIO 75703]|uniref:DoxX family membrane protein n=1 Tax=unclassified Streptomyces TaxID=2593676 RepID=UPI0004C204FD|nr:MULTISPECIES: DoxX family membrane protein [unclassified Streptomyces]
MAVHEQSPHRAGRRPPPLGTGPAACGPTTGTPARVLAGARMLMGFVFLWAFLDKLLGLGYATPSGRGWPDGGSPTRGFLGSVEAGPLESVFHSWAGAVWADWLFMLGLLGIGVALIAGVALRLAALAGSVMMALMWMAEWPPARHLSDGSPSMSTNPFADYHLVYAVLLVVLAAAAAGDTLGLGRTWARLPVVRDHHWLR